MDGGNEARSGGGLHFSPSKDGEPGGNAGTKVDDVGFFLLENSAQGGDETEGEEGFVVDGECDVAGAFGFELREESSAVGDDDGLVSLLGEKFAEFEGATLDTAGVEFWEDLDNFHGKR